MVRGSRKRGARGRAAAAAEPAPLVGTELICAWRHRRWSVERGEAARDAVRAALAQHRTYGGAAVALAVTRQTLRAWTAAEPALLEGVRLLGPGNPVMTQWAERQAAAVPAIPASPASRPRR